MPRLAGYKNEIKADLTGVGAIGANYILGPFIITTGPEPTLVTGAWQIVGATITPGGADFDYQASFTVQERTGGALADCWVRIPIDSQSLREGGIVPTGADGDEIEFTDAAGNRLYYNLDTSKWGNPDVIYWVKMSLTASTTHTVYLYAKSTSVATSAYYTTAVGTLIEVEVTADADDARVYHGDTFLDDVYGAVGSTTAAFSLFRTGHRMVLNLARGADIRECYFVLKAAVAGAGAACKARWKGEVPADGDAEDFAAPENTYAAFVARPRTTAYYDETMPAWVLDTSYTTPTSTTALVPVLKEILDNVNWASGNHIMLFAEDNGSTIAAGNARTWYSANNAAGYPKFYVRYREKPSIEPLVTVPVLRLNAANTLGDGMDWPNDIRPVDDADPANKLDYFADMKYENYQKMWVKVTDSLSAGETPDIYFCCGKPGDTSESDIDNMAFGDDFVPPSLDLAKWDQTNTLGYGSGIAHDSMWLRPRYCMQRYSGTYNRTYVAWVNKSGELRLKFYNHATTTWFGGPLGYLIATDFLGDIHEAPTMLIPTSGTYQGRIFLFAPHRIPPYGGLRIFRSDLSEDVSSWTEVANTLGAGYDSMYPQAVVLGDGKIALFWQQTDSVPGSAPTVQRIYFTTTSDAFATIAAATLLITNDATDDGAYPIVCQDGDVTHLAAHGWLYNAVIANQNYQHVHYMKNTSNLASGEWYEADGVTAIGGDGIPSFALSELEAVTASHAVFVHDMVVSGGVAYIVYAQHLDADESTPYWAHYTGGAWSTHAIGAATMAAFPWNAGAWTFVKEATCTGVSLDPNDPTHVFIGIKSGSTSNIQEWHTVLGDGTDFAKLADVTTAATDYCYQPYCVRNYSDDLKLLFNVLMRFDDASDWDGYLAAASVSGGVYSLAINQWHCIILRGAIAGLAYTDALQGDPRQFDMQVLHLSPVVTAQNILAVRDSKIDTDDMAMQLYGTATTAELTCKSAKAGVPQTQTLACLKALYFQSIKGQWLAQDHGHVYVDGYKVFDIATCTANDCYLQMGQGATADKFTFIDYLFARVVPTDGVEPTWVMNDIVYGKVPGGSPASKLVAAGVL